MRNTNHNKNIKHSQDIHQFTTDTPSPTWATMPPSIERSLRKIEHHSLQHFDAFFATQKSTPQTLHQPAPQYTQRRHPFPPEALQASSKDKRAKHHQTAITTAGRQTASWFRPNNWLRTGLAMAAFALSFVGWQAVHEAPIHTKQHSTINRSTPPSALINASLLPARAIRHTNAAHALKILPPSTSRNRWRVQEFGAQQLLVDCEGSYGSCDEVFREGSFVVDVYHNKMDRMVISCPDGISISSKQTHFSITSNKNTYRLSVERGELILHHHKKATTLRPQKQLEFSRTSKGWLLSPTLHKTKKCPEERSNIALLSQPAQEHTLPENQISCTLQRAPTDERSSNAEYEWSPAQRAVQTRQQHAIMTERRPSYSKHLEIVVMSTSI